MFTLAIPSIPAYALPTASDMPENKVSWTLNPKRAVLLIHDMQNYFVDAFAKGEAPITEAAENIKKIKEQCKALGIPVVYTAQPGSQDPADRALLTDFWGPGLKSGPYEEKIIPELAPDDQDIVLTKWRYSAFKRTNLIEIMRESGRDQLMITGIYAHIGCLVTACEAFMDDIQSFFIGDAVADFSSEKHKMAIEYASQRCAYTALTNEVLELLGGAPVSEGEEKTSAVLTKDRVREQIAAILQESPSDIPDHEDLLDRGLDSVRIMSLVEQWRRDGAEVTFVELAENPTLEEWWRLLSSRSQKFLPNADYL